MDNKNNIFAPPTQEELDLHSGPESTEPGQLEALARGAAQGISAGLSDEATAALESAFTPKTFEQALEESRAAYKASEEAHPITSFAGNIAGGIPLGGAIFRGVKAAASLPAIQKLAALTKLIPTTSKVGKLTSLVGRAAPLATTGAIEGAAYGYGQAEENIPEEVIAGAKTGAVLGAGGALVSTGLQAIGGAKNKLEIVEDVQDAFKLGKKGQGLVGQGSQEAIRESVNKSAQELNSQLQNSLEDMAFLKDAILKNSTKTVDMGNTISDMWEKLAPYEGYPAITDFKRALGGVLDSVKTRYQGLNKLPMKEADEIRKHLDSFLESQYQGITPPEPVRNVIRSVRDQLKSSYHTLDSVEAQKAYQYIPKEIGQELVSKYPQIFQAKNPLKAIDDSIHNILNATERAGIDLNTKIGKQQAAEKMSKVISSMGKGNETGRTSKMRMEDILDFFKKANPQASTTIGAKVDEVARAADLARAAAGQRSIGEHGAIGFLKGITSRTAVTGANVAGQISKEASDLARFQSPEALSKIVARANQQYGPKTARMLEEMFANYTAGKPNAAMNSLLQNPTFRQLMIDTDEE